jgi:DUF3011 family protein
MAHLTVPVQYFAFSSLCQQVFSPFLCLRIFSAVPYRRDCFPSAAAYLFSSVESNFAIEVNQHMKTLTGICTLTMLAALLFLGARHSGSSTASAAPAPPHPQGGLVTCSSDDGRRNFCSADVSGGVQLIRQRSGSPCVFNRTWGFVMDRGIWVDRGCRADFQVASAGGAGFNGWDNGYNVYCASDDGRRNVCPIDTRGGVQLIRKRSDSSCDYGRDWAYNNRGIWVDHGCRADFQIGGGGGNSAYGGDNSSNGTYWQPATNDVEVVSCSSDDMHRRECDARIRGNNVRLLRQRSDADCIYGRTWGYGKKHIWVDRGCRADFAISRGGGY